MNESTGVAVQEARPTFAERLRDIIFYVLILIAASYTIFVLPYYYPSREIVDSTSYAMGFNNKVSVIACLSVIALISLKMLAGGRILEDAGSIFPAAGVDDRPAHMGKTALYAITVITVAIMILLYWAIPFIGGYGEARYFFRRFEMILYYSQVPYKEIEFAYGPALVYIPIALFKVAQWMTVPLELVYLLIFLAMTVLGLWLLYYIVDNFQCDAQYRVIIFVLYAVCFFNISFGLQYTSVRYVLPLAAILWLHNTLVRRGKLLATPVMAAIVGFILPAVVLSISPEMGAAYLAAQTLFLLLSARWSRRYLVFGAVAGLLVLPVYLAVFSWEFFTSTSKFLKGANNFPVVPAVHIILYLAGLFYAIPILIAKVFKKGDSASARPISAAMSALILLMIPSALGRCDPGHVLFSGVGAFLVAFALLARYRTRTFTVYAIVFLLSAIVVRYISEVYLYRVQLQPVKEVLCDRSKSAFLKESPSSLAMNEQYGKIMIPMVLDWTTEHYLRVNRRIIPEYHPDLLDVMTPSACLRKLKDLEKADVVLVPDEVPRFRGIDIEERMKLKPDYVKGLEKDENDFLGMLFMYPVGYKIKFQRYNSYYDVYEYVANHFSPVQSGDGYVLMVRDKPPSAE